MIEDSVLDYERLAERMINGGRCGMAVLEL